MLENLKRLYAEGRLTAQGVRSAAARGWITAGQADEILGVTADEAGDN